MSSLLSSFACFYAAFCLSWQTFQAFRLLDNEDVEQQQDTTTTTTTTMDIDPPPPTQTHTHTSMLPRILAAWTVLGAFHLLSRSGMEIFLSWLPFYHLFKALVLFALTSPATHQFLPSFLLQRMLGPAFFYIEEMFHSKLLPSAVTFALTLPGHVLDALFPISHEKTHFYHHLRSPVSSGGGAGVGSGGAGAAGVRRRRRSSLLAMGGGLASPTPAVKSITFSPAAAARTPLPGPPSPQAPAAATPGVLSSPSPSPSPSPAVKVAFSHADPKSTTSLPSPPQATAAALPSSSPPSPSTATKAIFVDPTPLQSPPPPPPQQATTVLPSFPSPSPLNPPAPLSPLPSILTAAERQIHTHITTRQRPLQGYRRRHLSGLSTNAFPPAASTPPHAHASMDYESEEPDIIKKIIKGRPLPSSRRLVGPQDENNAHVQMNVNGKGKKAQATTSTARP